MKDSSKTEELSAKSSGEKTSTKSYSYNFFSLKEALGFASSVNAIEHNASSHVVRIKFESNLRLMRHGQLQLVPGAWGQVAVEVWNNGMSESTPLEFDLAKEIDAAYRATTKL